MNYGTGILIFCFTLSTMNMGWATETIETSPIIVQPYDGQPLNQQMLAQDRLNRDEEIEIQQLIEQNNKLTQTTLAHQEDEGLAQINQTMLGYRDALLSRDRARIAANEVTWRGSRYGDLIALTEDADAMTVHQDLEDKTGLLAQKYQMLSQLKDEMVTLNEKLSNPPQPAPEQATIEGFKSVAKQQQDKIQMLVANLGEMDQKINRLDDIMAQKDRQIAQLTEALDRAENELAALEAQPKTPAAAAPMANVSLPAIIVNPPAAQAPLKVPTMNTALPAIIVNPSSVQQTAVLAAKDALIKEKQAQVDLLKSELEDKITELKGRDERIRAQAEQIKAAPSNDQGQKDQFIKQQQAQIEVLKVRTQELSSREGLLKSQAEQIKIASENNQVKNETIIKQQQDQIAVLEQQSGELLARQGLIKSQAEAMARLTEEFKGQGAIYAQLKEQVTDLKNKMQAQDMELKSRDESIHWLNQVLAVAKHKAQYYQLTAQMDQIPMKQVQEQMQGLKDDFAQRFKDYDQFETAISSLKSRATELELQLSRKQGQVDQLKLQLSGKQSQMNLLNTELENKTMEAKNQSQEDAALEQSLKVRLQEKDNQIIKMKSDLLRILQAQANKEIYGRRSAAQVDDRIKLAQQLIDLQQQETALLDEKSGLEADQNNLFDQHALALEHKIKAVLVQHRIQVMDLEGRMQELSGELSQKQDQVNQLEAQLRDKITEEKNQTVLETQIQDLNNQLRDKTDEITALKSQLQSGQESQQEADSLQQQLNAAQTEVAQLKQQLDSKVAQSDQMTAIVANYQQKLESSNNAYNKVLQQQILFRNYRLRVEKQIADLNDQLQEKQAQVARIKSDMDDLQAAARAKDMDIQTKDLSLSMVQQKMMDEKVGEYQNKIDTLHAINARQLREIRRLNADLALARQGLQAVPSSDELEFLRSGLQKATSELQQKDLMLSQIKANADEYQKQFNEQTKEFQSLKDQLADAQEDIQRKDEDLKYKDMAITRLKNMSRASGGDLKDQVVVLTQRLEAVEKKLRAKTHANKVDALEAKLEDADLEIKNLHKQLDELKSPFKSNPLQTKLQQALDKIDEQGRIISVLAKKLEDAGQDVDLTKYAQ